LGKGFEIKSLQKALLGEDSRKLKTRRLSPTAPPPAGPLALTAKPNGRLKDNSLQCLKRVAIVAP
jgi:hypothetical protein